MKTKWTAPTQEEYRYLEYALEQSLHWLERIQEAPEDSFVKNQIRLHTEYSKKLLQGE